MVMLTDLLQTAMEMGTETEEVVVGDLVFVGYRGKVDKYKSISRVNLHRVFWIVCLEGIVKEMMKYGVLKRDLYRRERRLCVD